MYPSSFISEHTAEYVLVNDIVRRLSPTFQSLIPIFFWATREGNRTAIQSMYDLSFRLVTCFARRPKIEYAAPNHLFMKINSELIHYRKACAPLDIPVLAGLPMIKSLSCLRLDSPCCWFDLGRFESVNHTEFYVTVAPDGTATLGDSSHRLGGPLTNLEIEELVSGSPLLTWDRAVQLLRDVRRIVADDANRNYSYVRFPFFGGYKPFFLLVHETDSSGTLN
jgi:hypothetical protein